MKTVRYVLINAALAVSIYYGMFEGVDGARRLALFMLWFSICLSPFMFSDEIVKSMAAAHKGWAVPARMDILFDLAVITALVWTGWIVTAIGYTFHLMACKYMREEVNKILSQL